MAKETEGEISSSLGIPKDETLRLSKGSTKKKLFIPHFINLEEPLEAPIC